MSRPKYTVTEEHGDVHVTVRASLTPDEAIQLATEILGAAGRATVYRVDVLGQIAAVNPLLDHERGEKNMPPH